jgi:hypothetical protein
MEWSPVLRNYGGVDTEETGFKQLVYYNFKLHLFEIDVFIPDKSKAKCLYSFFVQNYSS